MRKWNLGDVLLLSGFCQLGCLSIFSWLKFTVYPICFQNHFPFSTFNLWRNKLCCMFPAAEEKWKRTAKSCALVSVRPSSSRTAVLFNHTSQFHSFQMISLLLPIFGQIKALNLDMSLLQETFWLISVMKHSFQYDVLKILTFISALSCYFLCNMHPPLHNEQAIHFFFFLNSPSVNLQMI